MKEEDDYAKEDTAARIVDDAPDSALSGRSLEGSARGGAREWHSNRYVAANVRAGAPGAAGRREPSKAAAPTIVAPARARGAARAREPVHGSPAAIPGARKSKLPATVAPTLATLVDTAPEGDAWVHEVKFDGYRMVSRVDHGTTRLYSRNGKEWTHALPTVVDALQRIAVRDAWLDGEVAVADANGRTSFQALQNALSDPRGKTIVYFVFDLLHQDGYDLRGVALTRRKELLRALVGTSDPVLRYSVDVHGAGAEFFKQACALEFEGCVSKRADSVYREGARTRDWVKVKCGKRQEMVVGGYTDPQGGRHGFGALLLGVYDKGKLRYAGKVGTGFDDRTLKELRPLLDKLERDTPPFVDPPRGYEARGAHWVAPEFVAEVAFTEWSNDGALRHPSFQGLRADKKARDIVRETAVARERVERKAAPMTNAPEGKRERVDRSAAPASRTAARGAPPARGDPGTGAAADTVAGVRLSHPAKLLFPETGLAKRDLALYYEKIADWILPHLRDRPLALVRCPDGWRKPCFFQKHADASVHAAVTRVDVPERGGSATYFAADSLPALVALVQWGVVELHPWGSRVPRLDRPDVLIFDFDPDEGLAWTTLVEAVGLLHTLLDDLGLDAFLKTTGGKGLHVVVPIRATLDWSDAKGFTKAAADTLVHAFPDRFTSTLSKAPRKGRIFIDYLRNAAGATAIAPYAIRARRNAPVSTPIAWDALAADVRFDHFTVGNVPDRLAQMRTDPWAAFGRNRRAVTKAMFRRVGYGR